MDDNKIKRMVIPVILSGGSGSRLWPLSRKLYPKQFLPLTENLSLLQVTAQRFNSIQFHSPIIICNQDHRFIVAEQLQSLDMSPEAIILEPTGRNTAPAIALAAHYCKNKFDNATLVILPADHYLPDLATFHDFLGVAINQAADGKLVTFGIKPKYPHTGYGYIKMGPTTNSPMAFKIDAFIEKPESSQAEQFIADECYLWNSGIFCFQVESYLRELKRYAPTINHYCQTAVNQAKQDLDFIRLQTADFEKCPSDSIDYAVMEHTQNAVVVPLDVQWNDIGSWSSLWDIQSKDDDGNVIKGDVFCYDVKNSYLRAERRLLVTLGIENCVIVETADAVLVMHKDHDQQVKNIVNILAEKNREEILTRRRVYRPWGSFETVDEANCHKVKRISVKPHASLSLQSHQHRSEHWIVVSGKALIEKADEKFVLEKNQSTYIPAQTKHRLSNPSDELLELIEVQSGNYLGEDDIVRYEDHYGRH